MKTTIDFRELNKDILLAYENNQIIRYEYIDDYENITVISFIMKATIQPLGRKYRCDFDVFENSQLEKKPLSINDLVEHHHYSLTLTETFTCIVSLSSIEEMFKEIQNAWDVKHKTQ